MGLDFIELVVEVEDSFHVVFDDLDLEKISTVGDLYSLLLKELGDKKAKPAFCPTQSVFYRFRKVLVEKYQIPIEAVSPKTQLKDIFPSSKKQLHRFWRSLSEDLGLQLPKLKKAAWIKNTELFVWSSLFITLFFGLVILEIPRLIAVLFLAVVFISIVVITEMYAPYISYVAPSKTLRELVTTTTNANLHKIGALSTSNLAVFKKLQHIFAEKCGVELEEVTLEKYIIDDLQID